VRALRKINYKKEVTMRGSWKKRRIGLKKLKFQELAPGPREY